ncbi:MAG: class I SAM-dependent methyltransferase [Kouleothrix sp.]|nr:class I SAM-dependent methyltransferase [Kouleothrix sp.]
MSRTVPQQSRPAKSGAGYDKCWTPWHGVAPLLPYLPAGARIWECCAGAGWLAQWLREAGHAVIATDYESGHDALTWSLCPDDYDVIVTNVPFSLKYQFIARCYDLGKPWALLVPYSTPFAATAKRIRDAAGKPWEELRLNKRINFCMPDSGFQNNGAQMTTIWLCHGLLPAPIIDAEVPEPRPEHRLIKPEKRRKPTRDDVVCWVEQRGIGPLHVQQVADLVWEAVKLGVPTIDQLALF